jgi:hypothetical protein
MTIKTAIRTEIERLTRPLWLLLDACCWNSGAASFEQLKSAALGIVALVSEAPARVLHGEQEASRTFDQ